MGHVFAVDGRPVLAGWGHAGGAAGRLARLDDGVPWRIAPRPPWGRYGAALGVLAGFALAAGLLLPLAPRWLVNEPAACAIVPGQLDAFRGQVQMDGRGQELRTLLATLTEEVGRAQLLCPIAVLPPTPAPAPPLQPRADLPRDQWDRQELAMLDGCWHLNTTLRAREGNGQASLVKTWQMCFDGDGHGSQSATLQDQLRCTGPLQAAFGEGGLLRVTHTQACIGPGLSIGRAELRYRRLSDIEAQCDGRNLDGTTFQGTFKR